jgi:hypothetical protein
VEEIGHRTLVMLSKRDVCGYINHLFSIETLHRNIQRLHRDYLGTFGFPAIGPYVRCCHRALLSLGISESRSSLAPSFPSVWSFLIFIVKTFELLSHTPVPRYYSIEK